jgi:hypothetical protein
MSYIRDFVFAWLDLKELMDDGGRCGRVRGILIEGIGDFVLTLA